MVSKPAGGVPQPVSTGEPAIGFQFGAVRLLGSVSIGSTPWWLVASPPIIAASSKPPSFSTGGVPATSKFAGHSAVALAPFTKYVFLMASAPEVNWPTEIALSTSTANFVK